MEKFIFIVTLVILGGCSSPSNLTPTTIEDGSTPDSVVTGDASVITPDGEVSEAAVNDSTVKDVEVVEAGQDSGSKDAGQDSSTDSQVSDTDVKDGSQNIDAEVKDGSQDVDSSVQDAGQDAGQDAATLDAGQDSGQDSAPVCVPTCSGLVPQTCSSNGTLVNGSPCPYLCAAGACFGVCVPGTKICSGLNSLTCNAAGQWTTDTTCPFVCSGNGICSGSCVPTSKDCQGTTPRTCDSTGTWISGSCQFVCSGAGVCGGVCTPNAIQCNGTASQTCNSSGQWVTNQTCPFVCSGNGTCSGSCVPTSKDCEGNTPKTCDSTGTWQNGSTCPFVCSSGSCTGVCVLGNTMCSGSQIQTCNSSGQWGTAVNCAAVAGATSYCSANACTFDCNLDYDDCDGLPGNGCEVNLNTDSNNCGICGHSCCGGACGNGTCGVYDTGITPYNYAYDVDANNIYWSTNTELNQQPRAGGSTTVLASSQPEVRGVDAYGMNVFWDTLGTGTNSTGSGIFSKPIGGGSMATYSTPAYGGYDYMVVTNSDIFWTDSTHSGIYYTSKTSGITDLLLGNTLPDGTQANLTYKTPFVTDGTYLYTTYSSYPTSQVPIVKVPVHGGPITTFASYTPVSGFVNYGGLSIDSTNLYYILGVGAEPSTTGLYKQPLASGTATKLVGSGVFYRTTATDGTNVYYAYTTLTSGNPRLIRKISINGGVPTTIASLSSTTSSISDIKVSNQCVYWYNGSTSTIQAVAVNP